MKEIEREPHFSPFKHTARFALMRQKKNKKTHEAAERRQPNVNVKSSLSCCGKVHNMSVAWLGFSQSTKLSSHREANYTVNAYRNTSAAGAAQSKVLSMQTGLLFHLASAGRSAPNSHPFFNKSQNSLGKYSKSTRFYCAPATVPCG